MGGDGEQKRTFLEEFFQLCSKLDSQVAFDGVMFEQGQDILRECSRFSVTSKTGAQSREMGQKLASEYQKRDRGGEGHVLGKRTLVPNFSRAMISVAGQSSGRKSSKSFDKCHDVGGNAKIWTATGDDRGGSEAASWWPCARCRWFCHRTPQWLR